MTVKCARDAILKVLWSEGRSCLTIEVLDRCSTTGVTTISGDLIRHVDKAFIYIGPSDELITAKIPIHRVLAVYCKGKLVWRKR